jgi:hypothetical protein
MMVTVSDHPRRATAGNILQNGCRFESAGSRTRLPACFGTDFPGLSSPRLSIAGTLPRARAEAWRNRGRGGHRWRCYQQY